MRLHRSEYKSKMEELITAQMSFEICDVAISDMFDVCSDLEQEIERHYFKCRVYTKNRLVTGLSGLLNPAWGIFSLATIAAHNILTRNPDYEIIRDLANGFFII